MRTHLKAGAIAEIHASTAAEAQREKTLKHWRMVKAQAERHVAHVEGLVCHERSAEHADDLEDHEAHKRCGKCSLDPVVEHARAQIARADTAIAELEKGTTS